MAKGGYQKRRIAEKKQREREERKRRERNRKILTVVAVVMVLGLIGGVVGLALTGGEGDFAAEPSGSPTPTPSAGASFADPCTDLADAEDGQQSFEHPPCKLIEDGVDYSATLVTSKGTIEVDLLEDAAPVTVNNFVFLARAGYYDRSIFHRVIPDFAGSAMIQGGDPVNDNGTGDPGYSFGDENLIPFDQPGYLAMANSGPATNGSQFFLLDGTVQHLNAAGSCPGPSGCHSIFGTVTDGLPVIAEIAGVKRDAQDKPRKDVVVRRITIHENGA